MKKTRKLSMVNVLVLSDFILKNYGPMSHLKLQKMLFYCQAYHLGYFGEALVDDDFQAWVHGPVCKAVYDALKDKSILYSDVKFQEELGNEPNVVINNSLSALQIELITDVLKELSTWTGFELESSTHRESPWVDARIGYSNADICEEIITKESMKVFYSKELNG